MGRMPRKRIDLCSIERENDRHKQSIAYWRKMLWCVDEDHDKQARLDACLCALCYYEQSRIGGASVTMIQCAFCDKRLSSVNTNVDVMCLDCAKRAGLCKHCGADVDLKNRRKRDLPTPTETIDMERQET